MTHNGPSPSPDPGSIADAAGLLYRADDRPGIVRRRRGGGFSYAGPRGGTVSAGQRQRIKQLVIPPAWRDVWVAPEPDAHLQATGIDEAGRKQYLYHEKWREAADTAKFVRLAAFAPALERLRRRVDSDLRARSGDLLSAAVVRVVDRCLIRPGGGSPTGAVEAVGATTLRVDHIGVSGGRIELDFVGKSGVDQHVEVSDAQLARVLSDLLDAEGDGPLFSTTDGDQVDERRLNAYIAESSRSGFTAKDFRTFGATSVVVGELGPAGLGGDDRDREQLVRDAIAVAADVLGNTPAVCRSSYVAPAVLDGFAAGTLAEHWRASRRGKWLSRAERATDRALHGRADR